MKLSMDRSSAIRSLQYQFSLLFTQFIDELYAIAQKAWNSYIYYDANVEEEG